MYYFAQVCRVCIKNDGKLIKIHDLDVDNISFYIKLTLCFPKMIFEETSMKMYLCQNCSDILRKMYDFRELCINSEKNLNTYVLQLEQANSFKFGKQNNLKELIDMNYKDLISPTLKSSEIKLEKFDSDIEEEDIKTETLDFEYVHVGGSGSSCLIDIKIEPVDTEADCLNDTVSADRADEPDKHSSANKDSGIQPPNTLESSKIKPGIKLTKRNNKEKRHKCDICSKCFHQTTDLRKHKRLHTGEKPYACDVCGKCFSRLGNLQIHKQIHTGEKPHVCDICRKCFNRSGNLQIHYRIHTGEKPFACDICSKSFHRLDVLQSHKRQHTSKKS